MKQCCQCNVSGSSGFVVYCDECFDNLGRETERTINKEKLVRVVSAALYEGDGFDVDEDEIDLSDSINPQEMDIHDKAEVIVDAILRHL